MIGRENCAASISQYTICSVRGGSCGAVLNGANEAAVARFLNHEFGFLEIARCVRAVLQSHHYDPTPTLEGLLALDRWARQEVGRWTPSPLNR